MHRRTPGTARSIPAVRPLALVVVAASLAACSGTADSDAPSASSPQGSAVDTALAELVPPEIRERGTVSVATSIYPPVDYYEDDGSTLTGFDYEIVSETVRRLGLEIEWNVIDFANVIPGIESGQYDFATDVNDTVEREEIVDFVTLFQDGTSLMTLEDNPEGITGLEDLCGRRVLVTSGSTQQALATDQSAACSRAGESELEVLEVPDDPDARLAMQAGRADVYLVNTLAGSYAQSQDDNGLAILPGVYDDVLAGLVFPKSSPELRDAVRAALQSTIDDGFYAEVMERYGVANNMIDEAQVNAAGS